MDPDDPDLWYVSASTGPYAAHRGHAPEAAIFRRRGDEPWQRLDGDLPDPLPAMPYALVAAPGTLLAGLADGQVWESGDNGATWSALELCGDPLRALVALSWAGTG